MGRKKGNPPSRKKKKQTSRKKEESSAASRRTELIRSPQEEKEIYASPRVRAKLKELQLIAKILNRPQMSAISIFISSFLTSLTGAGELMERYMPKSETDSITLPSICYPLAIIFGMLGCDYLISKLINWAKKQPLQAMEINPLDHQLKTDIAEETIENLIQYVSNFSGLLRTAGVRTTIDAGLLFGLQTATHYFGELAGSFLQKFSRLTSINLGGSMILTTGLTFSRAIGRRLIRPNLIDIQNRLNSIISPWEIHESQYFVKQFSQEDLSHFLTLDLDVRHLQLFPDYAAITIGSILPQLGVQVFAVGPSEITLHLQESDIFDIQNRLERINTAKVGWIVQFKLWAIQQYEAIFKSIATKARALVQYSQDITPEYILESPLAESADHQSKSLPIPALILHFKEKYLSFIDQFIDILSKTYHGNNLYFRREDNAIQIGFIPPCDFDVTHLSDLPVDYNVKSTYATLTTLRNRIKKRKISRENTDSLEEEYRQVKRDAESLLSTNPTPSSDQQEPIASSSGSDEEPINPEDIDQCVQSVQTQHLQEQSKPWLACYEFYFPPDQILPVLKQQTTQLIIKKEQFDLNDPTCPYKRIYHGGLPSTKVMLGRLMLDSDEVEIERFAHVLETGTIQIHGQGVKPSKSIFNHPCYETSFEASYKLHPYGTEERVFGFLCQSGLLREDGVKKEALIIIFCTLVASHEPKGESFGCGATAEQTRDAAEKYEAYHAKPRKH